MGTGSPAAAPLPGFRNLLINGNFAINQRGYASGGALASTAYAHDRWRDNSGGSSYTFTQPSTAEQAATHAVDNLVTITSGSITQPVEARAIAGGLYTLSWAGSASGVLTYYNGSAYTNVASGLSPLTAMIPAGVSVYATFSAGTLGTVQLEAGAAPTLFERRPIGIETTLCRRFFRVLSGDGTDTIPIVFATGSNVGIVPLGETATMRAAPTVKSALTDANYAVNPTSSQWALGVSGVGWCTKSGTLGFAVRSNVYSAILIVSGSFSPAQPTTLAMGSVLTITLEAEL